MRSMTDEVKKQYISPTSSVTLRVTASPKGKPYYFILWSVYHEDINDQPWLYFY